MSARQGSLTTTERSFTILNVRSDPADLLPQARIRHAALELFGQQGFDKTTIRQIASRAGVSPGLVMHHFGSKDGLRRALDDWIMELLSNDKGDMITGGQIPDLGTFFVQNPDYIPITAYIVTCMREGGRVAEGLFDLMYDYTEQFFAEGLTAGTLTPPTDLQASAVLLVAYAAGASMLGDQIARRLGGTDLYDPAVYQRYALASVELLTHGLFADTRFLDAVRAATAAPAATTSPSDDKEQS